MSADSRTPLIPQIDHDRLCDVGDSALKVAMKRGGSGGELRALAQDRRVAVVDGEVDRLHRCMDGETLCFILVKFGVKDPGYERPYTVVGVYERETCTHGVFGSEAEAYEFINSLS